MLLSNSWPLKKTHSTNFQDFSRKDRELSSTVCNRDSQALESVQRSFSMNLFKVCCRSVRKKKSLFLYLVSRSLLLFHLWFWSSCEHFGTYDSSVLYFAIFTIYAIVLQGYNYFYAIMTCGKYYIQPSKPLTQVICQCLWTHNHFADRLYSNNCTIIFYLVCQCTTSWLV